MVWEGGGARWTEDSGDTGPGSWWPPRFMMAAVGSEVKLMLDCLLVRLPQVVPRARHGVS